MYIFKKLLQYLFLDDYFVQTIQFLRKLFPNQIG